ncbi:MAG: hypothetical protein HZA32_13565 [Opitutae bacterium]|nr:hypothetical protein [Opitutae bacterium]
MPSPFAVAAAVCDRRPLRLLVASLALLVGLRASAQVTSEPAALAAKSLLLDITRAGDRVIAVGDRGHVLLSADDGKTWQQSITPTLAMLTCVSFPDADHGWAAGHDGVIIATSDGGKTWTRQDRGQDLETVFLDILFLDAQHGFVVGAYGKFLETIDGGKTWTARKISEEDVHFNRLAHDGTAALYLAGEQGTVLISRDLGQTWQRSPLDYEGSLFGVRPLTGGLLVAYGLRGRIFVSADDGAAWQPRDNDIKTLITCGARLREGVVVLAGQGGNFFISRDGCRSFHHWKPDDFGTSVADIAVARDGALITVGEAGAIRVNIP